MALKAADNLQPPGKSLSITFWAAAKDLVSGRVSQQAQTLVSQLAVAVWPSWLGGGRPGLWFPRLWENSCGGHGSCVARWAARLGEEVAAGGGVEQG